MAVVLGIAACGGGADEASRRPPDLLLVSVDTLRADRVSAYGYGRRTTPYLDEMAAEGVRYERAWATSSWTVPSVVSMLTGVYPGRHAMGGAPRAGAGRWPVISQRLSLAAGALRDRGYRTFGLTASFALNEERGFGRGFDRYECLGAVDYAAFHRTLQTWLPDIEASPAPVFVWLHLFDPHIPYVPQMPWVLDYHPAAGDLLVERGAVTASELLQGPAPDELVDWARAAYDSDVRAFDEYLRRLLTEVPRFAAAFVAVTADHGEEFREHGGFLHGLTLYEETLRIPMVLRFPDRRHAGTVVSEPVSLIDVLPTLVALSGGPGLEGLDGESLVDADGRLTTPRRRPVFAELSRRQELRAVLAGSWKLIAPPAGRAGETSLFDLESDPGELVDLADTELERRRRLESLLAAFEGMRVGSDGAEATEITPEQVRALEDLGYLD